MKVLDNLFAFPWADPRANNCNTYFIEGSKKILIDPGHADLLGRVLDRLARRSLALEDLDLVIVTHGHPDHLEAAESLTDAVDVALGRSELQFVKQAAAHFGTALAASPFEPRILLREGVLTVGDVSFAILETPGHSPGSICLYWPDEKALFTGDVVFSRGVGRTDLPGGNGPDLRESIKRLSELDVEVLLPGHGDMVVGRKAVKDNFSEIERVWFAYL